MILEGKEDSLSKRAMLLQTGAETGKQEGFGVTGASRRKLKPMESLLTALR